MTIDKEQLKALAEAQPVQVWTRTRGRRPDMIGQPLLYGVEGPEGVSDYNDWGFTGKAADYIAAACPATVLALIAEIEGLEARTRLAGVAGEMAAHEAVGRAANDYLLVVAERDQLKAERELLQRAGESLKDEVKLLKAENEALREGLALAKQAPLYSTRQDAKRYRFIRSDRVDLEQFNKVAHADFDRLVDEAMAKEASHE